MRRFEFTIDGEAFAVDVETIGTGEATVVVNGVRHTVRLDAAPAAPAAPALIAVPPAGPPAGAPSAAPLPAPRDSGIDLAGELMPDERRDIEVFRRAAPSVVYINSVAVRQNPLSFDVMKIPQGAGR